MTLTAMSPRLVLVLTVHAATHYDDSVDHCCTNMRAVSVVPAVKASFSVELLLLDSSSDSGLLSFVSSCFVPLAISHLCTNCHHFSFVMRIVSIQTCPVLHFNNESRPPSAVEDSFLTYTRIHDGFASISHQLLSILGPNSDRWPIVYNHDMRCFSFDNPSFRLSQHVLTTCPRTISAKPFYFLCKFSHIMFFDFAGSTPSYRLTWPCRAKLLLTGR